MRKSDFSSVFPGQGSQYVGMAKGLKENFPWTKKLYEEASEAVHVDLLKLCNDGPEDSLQLTQNAQPSILVTSYAWSQVCAKELNFHPGFAGGHSLGEYTALLSAEALTLEEAARLVRKRGELMQSAVPVGKGKMAAVLGLSDEHVEQLCKLASQGQDSLVVPANYNAPMQVVIAGHADAVDRAGELASGKVPELKARKVIPLKVSAPFHSPLMSGVAQTFLPSLESVDWKALQHPVVFNVDAHVRPEADVVSLLQKQVDHPVRWTQCALALKEAGVSTFVEMGPSKVLTGLLKRVVSEARFFAIDSVEDLKQFETYLTESK